MDFFAVLCFVEQDDRILLPEDLAVFGEIGLGGEIRSISHVPNRIREAERMGFEVVILPKHSTKEINPGT